MFQNEINRARNANIKCNFLCSMNGFYAFSVKTKKLTKAAISF